LNKTKGQPVTTFGKRVRELRRAKNLGQRALAAKVGVSFTYVSRIENENLDFGPYPSEELIVKIAKALEADADELMLLAKKIPEPIRQRVLQRPDAFRKLAALDDEMLDLVMAEADNLGRDRSKRRNPRMR
jgi:transcriptional regulator with XRE-family HTH domain